MKYILLFLLLFSFIFPQGEANPINIPPYTFPFIAGNDTLFGADTIYSNILPVGRTRGSISTQFEFETVGDSADAINIYIARRLSGMSFGVPYDSMASESNIGGYNCVDLGTIDSASVQDGDAILFNLTKMDYTGFIDEIIMIVVSPATIDTVYIKNRTRGQ